MSFRSFLAAAPWILAEGAIVERLRRERGVPLHPQLVHATMVEDPEGQRVLAGLYGEYLEVARRERLPMVVFTPTWRASAERTSAAGRAVRNLNGAAVRFLKDVVAEAGPFPQRVLVGGLVGCRGDAYRSEEGLPSAEAESFHAPQLEALAGAGVDFFQAATMPALPEALGMARAMAHTGVPFVISFVVRADGTLLDGTPLDEAVMAIDEVTPRPEGAMLNCVHARTAMAALDAAERRRPGIAGRVVGLQANTSALPPEALDGAAELDAEPPEAFAAGMRDVHRRYGIKILGGCCGSDTRHIAALAAAMRG